MASFSGFLDAILLVFYAILALAIPLIDAQAILPAHWFPPALVELEQWIGQASGHYLMAEKPYFFLGLVWVLLVLVWPFSVANIYGVLYGKSWVGTTSLVIGVSSLTSMAAIMGELIGSGRISEKLLQLFAPFIVLSALATLRGLLPRRRRSTSTSASRASSTQKKRA